MGPGNPFPDNVNVNSIQRPALVEYLTPDRSGEHTTQSGKQGCEAWSCAWSPDGTTFAWSCGHGILKLLRVNQAPANISDISTFNPALDQAFFNQDSIITIDTQERIWSVAIGSRTFPKSSFDHSDPSVAQKQWYSYKKGKDLLVAVGLNSGRIKVYDGETGQLFLKLLDHKDVVRDLQFAPDATQTLVSASRDSTLKVWHLQDDGNMVKTLRSCSKWLYACAWAPDARMLASVGDNRSVILWDMTSYKQLHKLQGHHHDVVSCEFSPDGALLATSSCDTRTIIWDPHTGIVFRELMHMFPPPSPIFAGGANDAFVRGVSWSRDGLHLATVSDDSYLRFWDISSPDLPCQVVVIDNALCCKYSPDGSTLAVGARNGSVSLWLAPMRVQTLQHSCRMTIRRAFATKNINRLLLPERLKRYVQYAPEI